MTNDIERARERRDQLEEQQASEELLAKAKDLTNYVCELAATPAEVIMLLQLGAIVAGLASGMASEDLVAGFTKLANELKLRVVAVGFEEPTEGS